MLRCLSLTLQDAVTALAAVVVAMTKGFDLVVDGVKYFVHDHFLSA